MKRGGVVGEGGGMQFAGPRDLRGNNRYQRGGGGKGEGRLYGEHTRWEKREGGMVDGWGRKERHVDSLSLSLSFSILDNHGRLFYLAVEGKL